MTIHNSISIYPKEILPFVELFVDLCDFSQLAMREYSIYVSLVLIF